tara:strand:+ start:187 stop:459 length:273 start_codon:yes stop_codon:yes gene_type:complete
MPKPDTVISILIGEDYPEVKTVAARARPEDIALFQRVFPEYGATSYVSGMIFKKIADALREHDITDVTNRGKCPELSNLKELQKNVRVIN